MSDKNFKLIQSSPPRIFTLSTLVTLDRDPAATETAKQLTDELR